MSVVICSVEKGSPAHRKGLRAGDTLLTINENEIVDVLDYQFYEGEERLVHSFLNKKGNKFYRRRNQ